MQAILYADGSKLETHYSPAKMKRGAVCNDEPRPDRHGVMRSSITAPDAGWVTNNGKNATIPARQPDPVAHFIGYLVAASAEHIDACAGR